MKVVNLNDGRPHCCFANCPTIASWKITHQPYGLEDYTHACTSHVGEVLTDATEHKIYRIEAQA